MQPKFKLLQTIGHFGKGEISMEQMVDAVDAYTSALLKQCNVSGRSEQVCLHDGKINSGYHADQPSWCDQFGEEL